MRLACAVPGSEDFRHRPRASPTLLRSGVPIFAALAAVLGATAVSRAAEKLAFDFPTPNRALSEGRPIDAILQDAGSGDPASGGCGCVRSDGTQFHEGIDIKAVGRDRAGEPTDPIFAAMDGVVRYINTTPGNSSYGRYIVLEHPGVTPAVYTLYAHLVRVAPGLKAGSPVVRGQTIATMGHSSGGYVIPKDRAHLHFEIGLWITQDFQAWYKARSFGSPNEHGMFNGLDLMGFDPLDFMRQLRVGRVANVMDYFAQMQPAVRVRIATSKIPDFARRYPSLLSRPLPETVAGWDVKVAWTGLPISLTPLTVAEVAGMKANVPALYDVNAEIEKRYKCKSLVVMRRGSWTVGKDLETVLQQLFALH